MRWLNPFQFLSIVAVTISLELVPLPSLMDITQAQPSSGSQGNFQLPNQQNSPQQSLTGVQVIDFQPPEGNFEPSEGNGGSGSTAGGGTRGSECRVNNNPSENPERVETGVQSVTVLIPISHCGLTLTEHPTFFLYFPQESEEPISLILEEVIKDEQGNIVDYKEHYEGELAILTDSSGISRVSLPNGVPGLKIDKIYTWNLTTLYQGQTIIREGYIQRVEGTSILEEEGGQTSSLELATEYASQGIWFDLVKVLAELRRTEPDNPEVLEAWDNLLKDEDVALDALANELFP